MKTIILTLLLTLPLIKAEGRTNPNADLAWAYMLKGDYASANGYILTLAKYKEFDALAKLMRISLAIAQYTGGIYFKDYQSDYTYVQAMATNNYSPYAPLAQAMLKQYEGAIYTTLQLLRYATKRQPPCYTLGLRL